MTKKEIKETISRRTKEAWEELRNATDFCGVESKEATHARTAWYTLVTLYEELFEDETNK